jgi:hypothetical protein
VRIHFFLDKLPSFGLSGEFSANDQKYLRRKLDNVCLIGTEDYLIMKLFISGVVGWKGGV